jgi:CDP-diacylglycerol--serine O-phosphatidyltransferase
MISQMPTYSFKTLRIQHRFILLTMLIVGLVAALAVTAPWLTLTIVSMTYVISFPFALKSYKKQKEKFSKPNEEPSAIGK